MNEQKMPIFLRFGLVFAITLLVGCVEEAPRSNPLDPALGNRLSGSVVRRSGLAAVEFATVRLLPLNRAELSDAAGNFVFNGTYDSGEYQLICSKDGFANDTLNLILDQSQNVQFQLNELPQLLTERISSRQEASFLPPNRHFVEFEVVARDPDGAGGITTVLYKFPSLGLQDSLTEVASGDGQAFFLRLTPGELGVGNLESLLGVPMHFELHDRDGGLVRSESHSLVRSITQLPRPLAPSGAVSMPFDFQWEGRSLGYSFHYEIEVYLNVGINLPPVDVISNIPSTATSLTYNNPSLTEQNYFWVLYFVDEFGNRSRSYETALIIN